MNLSDHFTLEEMILSSTATRLGIPNDPPPAVIQKLTFTAKQMEKVRNLLGQPISVDSGYRSPELNIAVGGQPKSQHCAGEAVDFICPAFGSPYDVAKVLSMNWNELQFDQLIWEGSWVHISFVEDRKPRGDVLTWTKATGYTQGVRNA
jgi:hypothetical protein